jgi:hypothetical protein
MGDVTPNMSIFVPSSGEELFRSSYAAGQSNIDLHRHTGAPTGGLQLISDSLSDGSVTPDKLSLQVRQSADYIANYGISYSNGTFSVTSSDGSAFSSTNRGFVTFQNKDNPGQLITLNQSANQDFLDAASGSSEIAGNLFGKASGVDSTQDVVFFLYAVMNDDQDTIQMMISPTSCQNVSPTTTNIGTPSNPIADSEDSFWSFDDITVGDYDGNPSVELGCFRMRKTGGAANDWTVQGLTSEDGIGACACSGGDTPPTPSGIVGVQNLSFIYDSGFFQVCDAFGNNLSTSNPAFVTLQSNVTNCTLVQVPIYANLGFRDSTSGSGSDIAGNLFGTQDDSVVVPPRGWTEDMPWFLYAVLSTGGDSIGFAVSRSPIAVQAPAVADCGTIGLTTADVNYSFYFLARDSSGNNVIPTATPGGTPTDYVTLFAEQPCLRLGAFRTRKVASTANDWTVQALDYVKGDGVGKTHASTIFNFPVGVNGANDGTYINPVDGGTPPTFTTYTSKYQLLETGIVNAKYSLLTCLVGGVGAFTIYYALPLPQRNASIPADGMGLWSDASAASGKQMEMQCFPDVYYVAGSINNVSAAMIMTDIAANDLINFNISYNGFRVSI